MLTKEQIEKKIREILARKYGSMPLNQYSEGYLQALKDVLE